MRRVVLAVISTIAGLVMLLSFKTHPPTAAVVSAPPATSSGPSQPSDAAAASEAPAASSSPAQPAVTKTVTGDSVDTRWGPVQVKITLTDGRITAADAVVYPQENPRDQQINSVAIPTLNQEAMAAGTASIDMVSGATYTSDGYIASLQSALNKANG